GNVRCQCDAQPRMGAPVEAEARWQSGGHAKSARLEELAWDIPKKHAMEAHAWVFTGSVVTDAGFAASLEGSLIASYRDPYAILNNPLPTGADHTIYKVNTRIVPPGRTPVTLLPRPASPPQGKSER